MKRYLFVIVIIFILGFSGFAETSKNTAKDSKKTSSEKKEGKKDRHIISKIVFYVPNVILDFVDIFKLNIGIGPGFGIHAQATEPLQAGCLFYDVFRIGLTGKRFDFWRHEDSMELGLCYAYYQKGDIKRNNSEIGGIVQLLILGAEASINLEEIGDFVSGIFFYDAKEDDLYFK